MMILIVTGKFTMARFNLLRPNCMIDLETLSSYFDAGILSIGATKFDHTGILDEFYVNIKLSSVKKYGLDIDKKTLEWWAEQKDEALEALFKQAIPLDAALKQFNEWFGKDSMPTYSKGVDFDTVIMREAYRKVRQHDNIELYEPWSFRDGLCARTMFEVFGTVPGLKPDFEGTAHNALDDARWQSQFIINIWNVWAEQGQEHV